METAKKQRLVSGLTMLGANTTTTTSSKDTNNNNKFAVVLGAMAINQGFWYRLRVRTLLALSTFMGVHKCHLLIPKCMLSLIKDVR
jgi:hypothetical protein